LEFIQRIDICINTHAKASPEYNTKPLFLTWSKGSEFETAELN
jgi:hypothetical protein